MFRGLYHPVLKIINHSIFNFSRLSKRLIVIYIVILTVIIGLLDYVTGGEISFSVFYSIPISLSTWYLGSKWGTIVAIISAIIWYKLDLISGNQYSSGMIPIWNAGVRLTFYCIIIILLLNVKTALHREKSLARTDQLTKVYNSRHFYECLQMEIDRSTRYQHSFSVVYLDLDNFKLVNDQFGHHAGDEALFLVSQFLRLHLRKIDVVARLGGDEFALLFPETDQSSAKEILAKINAGLLLEMNQRQWPITFSMGVITIKSTDEKTSVDNIIRQADTLMYKVKKQSKNDIQFKLYKN